MIRSVRVILFFAVVLITGRAQAQVYPVQGNSVLIPPYSVYLADYTNGATDRLILNLVLNDITRPELKIRLRARIIGQNITLETKPEYIGKELVLQGGIPLRITGSELTEYFNPDNLNFSGISRREFDKTGALPAGFYQFCFEVLEYNRGVKISNSICANGWLILNDPPIINLPRNGEKLTPTQPQNIVFQWTPRHTGSPNSAFSTEYDIKLVELWPVNRNPNDAILTSPPILEATTRSTTFIYDVSQTPLEPGRHYALQVKAKSIVGADELDLFKNNGKSEVITFIYGDACNIPQNILAEASSATRFTVKWTGDFNHTEYSLRYRVADNPTAQWYTSTALVPDAGVSALQPNTTYEFQVAGGCGVFESAYSGIGRIKTLDTSEQGYACGMPLEQFNLDPANLLDALKVGDVIQAGDFEVKIVKVSRSGGTLTGEGVIEVPFFNKANVKAEFSGIVVNKDMRMVSGYLNVTGAGVDVIPSGVLNLVDQLSETLSALDTALANIENNLPKPFDEHAFVADNALILPGPVVIDKDENGNVIITDAQGIEHRLPKGTEVAVVDDQGNGTLIDSQGKAHSVSATVATAAANREYNLTLTFKEAPAGKYGFDAVTDKSPDALKSRYRDNVLDGKYYAPYKSIETGATDFVVGVLEDGSIDRSKIRFEMGGAPVPSTPFNGDGSTITVSSKSDGQEQALIAVLPGATEKDKDQVLGRVNVVTYEQISKVLHIVPVNGNEYKLGTAESLQRELNRIYAQAIVNWSVTIESGIQVEGVNPFDVGQTNLLTNYTDHMKKVISAYKTAASIQQGENNFYLFLVNTPNDPAVAGYMPRSKQFGFIFYDHHGNEPSIARTMAHELGHGAFNLHHTFMEENFSLSKNSTDNLMDYAEGTKLYKYQWDMMRSAPIVMGLFESDKEAESVTITDLTAIIDYINEDKKTFTFLSPAGKPITIPANARDVVFATGERWITEAFKIVPLGTLIQFTVNDRILRARSDLSNFIGYNDNKGLYIDSLTNKINPKFAILGYPCFNNSTNLTFSVYQRSIVGYEISNNYTASGILKPFDFDLYTFYNDKHVNSKQISAIHSLSDEAQDYLAIRTEFAGCSNPLAPYIFINAYQITYNPNTYYFCEASQDYSNSILDRLPKPSSGTTITDPFKDYYDEVHKWVDGADVYRERKKILTEFKNLSSITDVDKIVEILTKYENYECLWKTISVGDRKYVLQKLIDGHVNDYWIGLGNNKENLFNQLLKTTEVTDRPAIIDLFEIKNYELLRKAYSKLDFGSNDIFIGILSSWISKIKYYEMSSASNLNEQPALSSNGSSWQVPEKMFLWRNEDGAIKDRHVDWGENNYFSYYSDNLNAKFPFSPFDIVKIKFESNFDGGINKGLEIVVPAIWAYRFQQNFYNKKLTDLARYLLDAAVIVGTLGSGTSTVALIEVGFSGTDMFLIASKDQLINSYGKDGENLLYNWDNLYLAYAGYTGVKQIAQAAGRMQLAFSLDDIASSFNKFSQEKRISITQNLKNFGDILKKLGQQGKIQNWEAAYYKFLDYVRTTQLQSLIADAPNLAQQFVIKVQDQVRVIVFNSLFNYQLAKFDIRNGEIFLSELKWISLSQEGSFQVLGAINPISYEDRILRVVSRKKLEIVFHDSKVYLREINSADDVLSHSFINGYSFEEISKIPKLNRLNPEVYLSSDYISNHLDFFKSEGGAFVVVKSWIEESSRTEFPLKKYVMLKSDMLKVVDEYKRVKDIKILENGLGYSQDALKGLENEIYIFYAESNKFKFDMPSGNEAGANLFWTPGGKTFGGLKEAVIIDLENPTVPLKHNKSVEYLKTQLKYDKLIN